MLGPDDLFAPPPDSAGWRLIELQDGARLRLCEHFLSPPDAEAAQAALLAEVPWAARHIVLFGKQVLQPRLVSWHGDAGASYRYSGVRNEPAPWTPALAALRESVTAAVGAPFNSVLCNQYRDGHDSMGLHSDDEPELGPEPLIASLSLGATRRFFLVHRRGAKRGPRVNLLLTSGSLLVMEGTTQHWYRHGVPKEPGVTQARINLTFRVILTSPQTPSP